MKSCPYDDQAMRYDLLKHRYVLTENYAYTVLGIPTDTLTSDGDNNNSVTWQRFLKRVADDVYNYIYRDSQNHFWLEYLLATYAPLRPCIQELLTSQLEYSMQNGILTSFSGVNLKNGTVMKPEELRGRVIVSPTVEMLAEQKIQGLGYSLKYMGSLPDVPSDCFRKEY